VGVVSAYFVLSIAMVFVNKLLMDPSVTVSAPFAVSSVQAAITAAICIGMGQLGRGARPGSWLAQFPPFSYDLAVGRAVMPLSIVFCGMLAFNNLCLQYVEVSFYQVARSLTIVFNVFFTWWLLGERTGARTLGCLAIVILGFFIGSGGEVRFSLLGTLFGVASSVFVSLNSIYTKKVMPVVDGNQWALAAYNNMNAVIIFLPIVLLTEGTVLLDNLHILLTAQYWGLMMVGGVFGFGIGIATILQIKLTSPLTHNISGTAKACVQTVLALFIWRNPTTLANLSGIGLVLAGSFLYAYVRNQEMEAANTARRLASKSSSADISKAGGGASASATPAQEGEGAEAETGTLLTTGGGATTAERR